MTIFKQVQCIQSLWSLQGKLEKMRGEKGIVFN